MNDILYTAQARADLTRIDWKVRVMIIETIASVKENNPYEMGFKKGHGSDLLKLVFDEHVVIGKIEKEKALNILTIQKKQKIKVPEAL